MPLFIIRHDITKVRADAIVNAANPSLLGGGGVDGAIHRAAGEELLQECKALGGCAVGEAKITKGYRLPATYVIHAVGPVWAGGHVGEEALLTQCYGSALRLAKAKGLERVAFPLISSGVYGYPKDQAFRVAVRAIGAFLEENDMTVLLVVYDKDAFKIAQERFDTITQYIDDRYEEENPEPHPRSQLPPMYRDQVAMESAYEVERPDLVKSGKRSLEEVMAQLEETFSQHLLRLIDDRGMTDAAVYKRANVDRKHFSKIRNDVHYQPSKHTAIAFAIALELSLDEAKDLLAKAGYALSRSSRFDLIIAYFLEEGASSIHEVNQALFTFDEKLLGV